MKRLNKLSFLFVIVTILGSGVMVGGVMGYIIGILTGLIDLCG